MSQVKKIYRDIQDLLVKLVPEKYKSIYLYASVINGKNGEMFFYYFPKRIIKTNPINCYDIPDKFGLEENSYNANLQRLYGYIRSLFDIQRGVWTNITIKIEENIFTIEYHFNNLVDSKYNDEERRLVWCNKYLQIPTESLTEQEAKLIDNYVEESRRKPVIYSEALIVKTEDNDGDDENGGTVTNQILKF